MENYLVRSGDFEMLQLIQPFYVFRALVVASPVWYPALDADVRIKLFNFIDNVIAAEEFDYKDVNQIPEKQEAIDMAWAVWFTGLPGSGKTTVAREAEKYLAGQRSG